MSENPVAFKNGADIHFDYKAEVSPTTNAAISLAKKRKKRKSKSKKSTAHLEAQAHLNDPDEEYPTSRVIKQAPNGDVIVESLEESHPPSLPRPNHSSSKNLHKHPHDHHQHPHDHSTLQNNLHNSIWDSASIEEQENLKLFWESLDEAQKVELVKIDKKSIMEIFKNESRQSLNNHHHHHNQGSNSNGNNLFHNNCTCSYCGRRSNIIEDELENIYDKHFDDIIDFIHEVRDINDLNALPGLLFGGFHMLEEEHKLQKRRARKEEDYHNHDHNDGNAHDHHEHNDAHHDCNTNNFPSQEPKSFNQVRIDKINDINDNINFTNTEKYEEIQLKKALDDDFNAHLRDSQDITKEQKIFNKLLDPKLVEALENLDFEKMKSNLASNENISQALLLQKAGTLKEIIRDLHKADKAKLEEGMSFLQNMGDILSSSASGLLQTNDETRSLAATKLTQGLSSFAEDLLKNDGHSFIDMMESLSESRTAREGILKKSSDANEAWVDDDDTNRAAYYIDKKVEEISTSLKNTDFHPNFSYPQQELEEEEEFEEEEDEEEDEEEEDEDEEEDDEEEDVEEEGASDTESEISEEEKMQEIRRLFLIQVIKLFQERLKKAYKEKLSKDRTQKLIEELEAEENAKKERELKKLKQREKAKEKKKLQQLAKEEERKRKEEEQRQKEEDERQRLEANKAEQKRKKEEARLKKEEEKKKRIEELKRKEEEHRKRVEAQLKKEEEAKKLKEERRKKAEEERKRREDEKKQKEILKKQREEERLVQKLERERLQVEAERLEQERLAAEISLKAALDAVIDPLEAPKPSSPSKNHLLEQLYQARPNSISGQSSNLDTHGYIPGALSPLLPNSSLQSLSPSSQNNLLYGQNGSNTMSPWASKSRLNSTTQQSQSNLFQSQFSNNFSPFKSGFGSETVLTDPFNGGSISPAKTPQSSISPGVWGQPRNSSIWSSTPANSIWGNGANNNIPSVANNIPNVANVGANVANVASVGANMGANVGANVGGNVGANVGAPGLSDTLIQSAAYHAFQYLQTSNQLEFGVVPLLKLYQSTKDVLANTSLTVTQFLGACRSNSTYQFDMIYDDFGTVTHIKVSELYGYIPMQGIQGFPMGSTQGSLNMLPSLNGSVLNGVAGGPGNSISAGTNPSVSVNPGAAVATGVAGSAPGTAGSNTSTAQAVNGTSLGQFKSSPPPGLGGDEFVVDNYSNLWN